MIQPVEKLEYSNSAPFDHKKEQEVLTLLLLCLG